MLCARLKKGVKTETPATEYTRFLSPRNPLYLTLFLSLSVQKGLSTACIPGEDGNENASGIFHVPL